MLCNNGEEVNTTYDNISSALYLTPWYLYPDEIRKFFPVILNFAQKDVRLQGAGGLTCTRDTFKQVLTMKSVY